MTGASSLEQRTIRKVSWRILPLVIVVYLVAYIDRTNVAFAAIGMNRDLGFSTSVYGWGAGMFFIGYFLFEVPSNMALHRVGARRWIARIMVTWGIVSGLMALVVGEKSFIILRFLLGAAEAGFFPGVLLYFTYWFPSAYRARVFSALYLAVPVSNAVAAALSGALLQLDGLAGLAGWQWLFIIESIPAVLLAPVVLIVLADRPAEATWLDADERAWLDDRLQQERRAIEGARTWTLFQVLTNRHLVALSLVYLTIVTSTYGITFFLPLMVKAHGLSNVATGLATAAPYTVGALGMLLLARSSDRRGERRWHFVISAVIAAGGFVLAASTSSLAVSLVAIAIAAIGLYGAKPVFWPVPSAILSGTAAAGGIAMINSIGNLGGFVGPYVVGWIRDATHGYVAALWFLAACALASAALALIVIKRDAGPRG